MIEVVYYYNTSNQWIIDFAAVFSKQVGASVSFKNNKLTFPPSVANGRFEYYELNENLGVLCVDIVFMDDILLHKKELSGNDYYALIFDVSDEPIKVIQSKDGTVRTIGSLVKSVMLGSHAFNSAVTFQKNARIRYVQFSAHRSWGMKNIVEPIPVEFTRFKEFANAQPMSIMANFDTKSYELVNEVLEMDTTRTNFVQLLDGYASQLIALFFNNLKEEFADKKNAVSPDAMRIVQLKEIQEQNLSESLTLPKAAAACLMSPTKFAILFQSLFGKTYGAYFMHKKMEKAKELLDKGFTVADTGVQVGYNNTGYFARIFKKHFGVMPRAYKNTNS
ncbi:MAG: helix-turn-helix transcriptional regulator [Filimonas sp.]|nr:helix-turn-helix transcriptional regulator [Filimonas sp.]